MDAGYCTFEQVQLVLDGLVPKEFRLTGLRFERFPLGATVQHAMPPEVIEDVEGHLSMTLTRLTTPLNRFPDKSSRHTTPANSWGPFTQGPRGGFKRGRIY